MGGSILTFKNENLFDEQQLNDVKALMETTNMTIEQAMNALRVMPDKRAVFIERLAGQNRTEERHKGMSLLAEDKSFHYAIIEEDLEVIHNVMNKNGWNFEKALDFIGFDDERKRDLRDAERKQKS